MVLPAMNGVPWWFMPAASPAEPPLESVDPGGRLLAALPIARVLGCVVHLTCLQPGARPGPAWLRRAADRRRARRRRVGAGCGRSARALAEAGFKAEASTDVRREVWYKLWGNMTMNPVSALTGAESTAILDDPLVHAYMIRTMAEAAAHRRQNRLPDLPVGRGADRPWPGSSAASRPRCCRTRSPAGRSSSTPWSRRSTRSASGLGVPTPNIGALLGLTRLMARQRGLYPCPLRA